MAYNIDKYIYKNYRDVTDVNELKQARQILSKRVNSRMRQLEKTKIQVGKDIVPLSLISKSYKGAINDLTINNRRRYSESLNYKGTDSQLQYDIAMLQSHLRGRDFIPKEAKKVWKEFQDRAKALNKTFASFADYENYYNILHSLIGSEIEQYLSSSQVLEMYYDESWSYGLLEQEKNVRIGFSLSLIEEFNLKPDYETFMEILNDYEDALKIYMEYKSVEDKIKSYYSNKTGMIDFTNRFKGKSYREAKSIIKDEIKSAKKSDKELQKEAKKAGYKSWDELQKSEYEANKNDMEDDYFGL